MLTNIPLSCADITDLEIRAASDALRGERLVLGPWTNRFEQAVSQHVGSTFGVATNSAQSAMHITLESIGITAGDEVIIPAFAFPSTASTLLQMGAVPVFADCDARTLNMNAEDVSAKLTDRTRAIIASHTFGNPSGIDSIAKIALEQEIPLIEDASQAIGSKLDNRQVGTFGRATIFAFHSTTQLSSVEGGVITTDDDALAAQCNARRNHGLTNDPSITTEELHHVRTDELMQTLGHGYRLSEVHAAVGAIQMSRFDEIMQTRNRVSQWYTRNLVGLSDIMCPTIEHGVEMSWDGYVVRLSDRFSRDNRDEIIRGLHRHDIGAADYFQSIPSLSLFAGSSENHACPVAESISMRTLALPFFTTMSKKEVEIVCQTLELMLTRGTFLDI